MSTPKSPHPALSRTPDRVSTSTPQERIGTRATETAATADQPVDGINAESAKTLSLDTSSANNAKRRSFFGRLFQPSTENLTTPNSKRAPPRTPSRHARQTSQQSLASTETYGEVLERDGAAAVDVSERKLREQQALMGREVLEGLKQPDEDEGNSKHGGSRSIHAPIPNPRRASGGVSARAQTKDRRELSVIEDEGVNDDKSGDEGAERKNMNVDEDTPILPSSTEGKSEYGNFDAAQEASLPTEATETPTAVGEPDTVGPIAPPELEAQGPPVPDQNDPVQEEERKIPTAPPSPSLEHELEVMGVYKARKQGKGVQAEI